MGFCTVLNPFPGLLKFEFIFLKGLLDKGWGEFMLNVKNRVFLLKKVSHDVFDDFSMFLIVVFTC